MQSSYLDIAIRLAAFAALIAITAFFVACEFAIVKVRSSRLDQLIVEGNQRAVLSKKIADNLDEYLSACQLGITISALGMGMLGQPTVHIMLAPVFDMLTLDANGETVFSFVAALAIVTYLHVVLG